MQQQNVQTQSDIKIEEYFWILFHNRWVILAILLVAVTTAFIKNDISPPVYEATATIWIKEQGNEMPLFDDLFSFGLGRMTRLETLRELIKTPKIVRQAVEQEVLSKPPLKKHRGEFVTWISGLFGFKIPEQTIYEGLSEEEKHRKAVDDLLEALNVEIIRDTDIMKVTVKSSSPERATKLANTIAEIFQDSIKEDMQESMTKAADFATTQLAIIESNRKEAEEELKEFERKEGTILLDKEAEVLLDIRAELDRKIYLASADKIGAEASRETLIQELSNTESKVISSETLSQNPILMGLEDKRIDAEIRLSSLKKRYLMGDHLDIKSLEGEINDINSEIANQTEELLSATITSLNPIHLKLKQDIIEAQTNIAGYKASIRRLEIQKESYNDIIQEWPDKKIHLMNLRQKLVLQQNLQDSLMETQRRAEIAKTAELGNVRIWDRPIMPEKPVSPKKLLNLLLGVIIGAAVGIGLGFLREYLDNTYPSLEDAQQAIEALSDDGKFPVPVSFLAMIPAMEETEERRISLMAHDDLKAGASEAFRLMRTKLQFLADTPPRVMLITSSTPSEGKTTIASNLAITFAQMDKKVILVDADLRRPSLHKIYETARVNNAPDVQSNPDNRETISPSESDTSEIYLPDKSELALELSLDPRKPGLTELLLLWNDNEPEEALKQVVKETEVENLFLLTSGTLPPNPSERLNSDNMKQLVEFLQQQYDYVIFDTPPVLSVADPVILSSLVECVIYVFDIAKTKKPAIRDGLEILTETKPKNIGVACNLTESQYYGYGYGYGYGRYGYSKYGYYYSRYKYSYYYDYYASYGDEEEAEDSKDVNKKKRRTLLPGRNNDKNDDNK